MINYLNGMTIYLAGAIENDSSGTDWRQDYTKKLKEINGLTIWSPIVKPQWASNAAPDAEAYGKKTLVENWMNDTTSTSRELFYSKDIIDCLAANDKIFDICKNLVNKCDIVIARLPDVFSYGTCCEITIAIERDIPVFVVFPDGKIRSIFLVGKLCKGNQNVFNTYIHNSFDSLFRMLKNIDNNGPRIDNTNDELEVSNRWIKKTWIDATN